MKYILKKTFAWGIIICVASMHISIFSQGSGIENNKIALNKDASSKKIIKKYKTPKKKKLKKRKTPRKKKPVQKHKKPAKKYFPKKRKTVPQKTAIPVKKPAPEKNDTLKEKIVPQNTATPEKTVVPLNSNIPKQNTTPPENTAVPQSDDIQKKNTTTPENTAAPENTDIQKQNSTSPENTIVPQSDDIQKQNTTPPEKAAVPQGDDIQKKTPTIPENTVAPENTDIHKENVALPDAQPAQPEDGSGKISGNYLTGDWSGFRQKMSDQGLILEMIYTNESAYNAMGGLAKGYAVLGNLDITLDMDMEKAMGWSGGEIYFYGLGGHGQSPSELVGDLQATSNIEAGMNYFKLYQAWVRQSLLDGKISLLLGLHDLNSENYVTESSGLFINSSFGVGADLSQTGVNGPSIFPSTAPALKVKVVPVEHFYINFAGYNAIAGNPGNPSITYIDFSFAKGLLLIAETGYEVEKNIKIAAGGWMYTQQEKNFSNINATGYGSYVLFEKNIGENFSLFTRAGMANPEIYQIAWNISGGIYLSGALWGRNDDELGLGVTSVINSKSYQSSTGSPTDTQETSIELTYKIQANPWFSIQPDAQYVLNPGTDPSLADAFIVSLRAKISF